MLYRQVFPLKVHIRIDATHPYGAGARGEERWPCLVRRVPERFFLVCGEGESDGRRGQGGGGTG